MKKIIFLYMIVLSFKGAHSQDLQTLIDEALKNSPEIQQRELQYRIASEQVKEVNTIGNTELGLGYFVSEPETRTGPQRFKVSARQMVPWFGAITARENYMGSLADAQYEDVVISRRKLVASVSQSYYRLYALKAEETILKENMELLKTYETMALTAVRVSKASAVDVLRLQIRKNDLEKSEQILAQHFTAEQTVLNKLMNRDQSIAIIFSDSLVIPALPEPVSMENLQLHPELVKYDKLYGSVTQSELLSQKESGPVIGIGLDYINVTKRPDMTIADNGKDILMPMVSMSIPVFNKSYRSKSRQHELKQQELAAQKQERMNALETLLQKAVTERNAAVINYNTQSKNLDQAKIAGTLLLKNYETGTISFNDLLDIQQMQLKFKMELVEAIKNYYLQQAIINYLSNTKY